MESETHGYVAYQTKEDHAKHGLFIHMVGNAFEFLNQALDEFEDKPLFSVVHFATAIELFLKARLLKEHWLLVIKDIDRSNWNDFTRGTSITITPALAKNRLKDIAKDPIPEETWKTFNALAKHRNRVIHFGKELPENENLAIEQHKGWVSLQALITKNWNKYFATFDGEIANIERKMLKHISTFLPAGPLIHQS